MPATRTTTLRRSLAAAAALPLLIGTLAACGYGSDSKDDKTAPAAKGKKLSADTVRLGYFPNLTHATALVGEQEGILQKELGGTQIKSTTFNAGPSEIEALNAGSIDIGFIGPSPAINGFTKSKGKNLRIVAGSASGGVKLVVNPAKIKTLDDLKGKKIATPQHGNTQDVAFLNWIAERGWKTDAQSGKGDVSVVRTDNKITPDAYKSGSIDGAWVPEPTASRLVSQGAKVLLDEATIWPEKKFVITHVIVSQKFLKDHADVVEAFVRGTVKTNAWINANPDKAKASANAKLKALSGKELPAEIIDGAWPSIQFLDDPLASTLQAQADHAVKAGLLEKPDLVGIYDLSLLNKVLKAQGAPEAADAGLGVK
ncbi:MULTISPECIES: aliphatic sulfonate ABC transporter substrate-binding protein [Streptomyces]|uniref:Aliphatic sulfonate ABC transporter substrate-binding protein n=1 Tax=Streptomyces tsukubensis (strain DSM 42081 / NBRC 108919 / NRRL 18488 / 9993) TaxID=1114943 RepID=I2N8K8_STRT9|nr:aliphatic sulfonate ABC transporter substrate-binding protein [Streptomyces tsukubensis]MYS65788.1 aliphatic sulfonate ABC transporter substrate-binding protein [Streptomyces sp. SID5473]AZK97234.1 sulfate ABC transporter substrate-binding protein [Streptomyces tsukubensis]EIF93355.1 aliphatic sulfonate ABC transporter substrate-binding protein [Streptomyces tsukubensis NRRL18488]QKM66800.1 aliphatic sulfonate ABC transporter substrate-binding protein [Streptomyces tsukubensis NRRL18488]TAI